MYGPPINRASSNTQNPRRKLIVEQNTESAMEGVEAADLHENWSSQVVDLDNTLPRR